MSKVRSVSNTVSNIRADNPPPPIHLTGLPGARIQQHLPPWSAVKFAAVKLRLATHRARSMGMGETLESCSYAPSRRGGFWVYVRRVPKAFAPYDDRGVVKLSTGIRIADDPKGRRAAAAVARLNAATERYWADRAAGFDAEALRRYEANVAQSVAFGFEPISQRKLLALDDEVEFITRVNAAITASVGKKKDDTQALEAFMGVAAAPGILVSQLVDEYQRMGSTGMIGMSVAQVEKWRAARLGAISSFTSVIGGDRLVSTVKKEHVRRYREYLQERIKRKEISTATANKSIKLLGAMYRAVNEYLQLEAEPAFDKMLIKGPKGGKRRAYPAEYLQSHFLKEGALDGLNREARGLLYLLVETGLRLSEACNLNAGTIILDHEIPFVRVFADGRALKTEQSARDIPLVGVALMAMRENPIGFPRYKEKASSCSAAVNKFLRENGLRPQKGHSVYSLRHTFKDRMRNAGATDDFMDLMMGHLLEEGKDYGEGHSLAFKARFLERMAFRPPSRV